MAFWHLSVNKPQTFYCLSFIFLPLKNSLIPFLKSIHGIGLLLSNINQPLVKREVRMFLTGFFKANVHFIGKTMKLQHHFAV